MENGKDWSDLGINSWDSGSDISDSKDYSYIYNQNGYDINKLYCGKIGYFEDENGDLVFDEETTNQSIASALTAKNYTFTEQDGVFSVKLASTMTVNAAATVDNLEFNLHVGADSSKTNKIGVSIASMSADGLGVSGIKVTSEKTATDAIDVIAQAIQKVSKQRSELGAVQNRLEHTINNLDNVVENTTAAESRIRDTDMAKEMVKYSNLNILGQAGQSMLAQANQANQGVLSLLG